MNITPPEIDAYLNARIDRTDPALAAMEQLAREQGFPIVGPQAGRLLRWLAEGVEARRVLELGSGFGYSAWWLAHAVGRRGYVILTEGSKERCKQARAFLDQAGLAERARIEPGDALQTIARLDGPFDLIFNDLDKPHYPVVPDLAADRLRPGGLLVSDNTLWHGAVLDDADTSPATRGIVAYNDALRDDPRFDTVWLPLGDGLAVSRRTDS